MCLFSEEPSTTSDTSRQLKAMNLCGKKKYEIQKHLAKFLSFLLSSILFPGGVVCPLITEIFIQSYRPTAYVFNGVTNWIQLFILGFVFPFIVVSKAGCFFSIQRKLDPSWTQSMLLLSILHAMDGAQINCSSDGLFLFNQVFTGSAANPQNASNSTQGRVTLATQPEAPTLPDVTCSRVYIN